MRKLFADTSSHTSCAALFPKSVEELKSLVEAAKKRATTSLDGIYAVAGKDRNFENTGRATDLAEADLDSAASLLSVVKNTAVEKAMRESARDFLIELESFSIEQFSSNKKLYKAFKEYLETADYKNLGAGEEKYWVTEEVSSFQRHGLELEGQKFEEVVELQKKIAALSTTFSSNTAEDDTTLHLTEEQLKGTPAPVLSGLERKDNSLVVKMDYPTYFGIMKNCEVAETRKMVAEAFENRAYPANLAVLRDVIQARHQLATKLGYTSFAAYNLDDKMIKSPENAKKFVEDLIPGLQKKWEQEKKVLTENLHPSVKLTDSGDINSYDIAFCMENVKRNKLNVSETTIQEYFPMDATIQALFDIYQSFFDITFVKHQNGNQLWHTEVFTLEVVDNRTKVVLGYIILDLFPREGKFSHACCHGVIPAVEREDGTFSPALSVVLANFPKAQGDRPALFLHNDVETFFHEFGHAIHNLMGRSRMATFSGTRVKRDFVELPSQMLEEWLWESSIIKKVSRHYKTGEPLPDALIKAKIDSQNAFSGRDSLRQLQFATYSLDLFSTEFASKPAAEQDTTKLFQDIQKRIMGGIQYSTNGHFECAFGHLMGYGAGYYGYMYSKVLALDVFDYIKSRDGLLSSELGRRYVKYIIGVGGARDPNDMVKDFLEREPSPKAFLAKLGIQQ